MAEQNLPALQQKAVAISDYLGRDYIKKQLAMALPKHLTADRLLRVAMTTIRHNKKLLECSLESLLASVMGCAQLGLEPEPSLGQAYLVPYWNTKKNSYEAQLIPGYRGYITLARRSGEVQNVSAQVVYENDHFKLQYGLKETLDHIPADGDRGAPKGAYVVFRYKDGSHSFDYMTVADIEKIKERSKSRDKKGNLVGPWVTDEDEMRKKTVIRRHIKLVPLSVEMATAAAAEEKAFAGESQAGLFLDTQDADFSEVEEEEPEPIDPEKVAAFDALATEKIPAKYADELRAFLAANAKNYNCSVDEVKVNAAQDFDKFLAAFKAWLPKDRKPRSDKGTSRKPQDGPEAHPKTTAQEERKPAATGSGGAPKGITDDTLRLIGEAANATGVHADKAYAAADISTSIPLDELDEESGQKILAYYKAL